MCVQAEALCRVSFRKLRLGGGGGLFPGNENFVTLAWGMHTCSIVLSDLHTCYKLYM